MQMSVSQNIIKATHEKPGLMCGVAQVREFNERGRVTKEGCTVLVLKDEKGTEVRVLLTPDEATTLGMSVIGCAMRSGNMLPPDIVLAAPEGGTSSGLVLT